MCLPPTFFHFTFTKLAVNLNLIISLFTCLYLFVSLFFLSFSDFLRIGNSVLLSPFILASFSFNIVFVYSSLASFTPTHFINTLIEYLKPKYFVIENPQTGLLKKQPFMNEFQYDDVDFCKYGMPYRKRTRLWNNLKIFKPKELKQLRNGCLTVRKAIGATMLSFSNRMTFIEYQMSHFKYPY